MVAADLEDALSLSSSSSEIWRVSEIEIEKAWHVFSVLLSLGRPACAAELAARCRLFAVTEEFVEFLCSIPDSPLLLTGDRFVTVSLKAVLVLGEFVAKWSGGSCVPRTIRICGPKRIWDEIGRTYYRKRKGQRLEANVVPVAKRRLVLSTEIGEGDQMLQLNTNMFSTDSIKAHVYLADDIIREMNFLPGDMSTMKSNSSIFSQEIPMRPLLLGHHIDSPSNALIKIDHVKRDNEEETASNAHRGLAESVHLQACSDNLLGFEIDLNFPRRNFLDCDQEPAPLMSTLESSLLHQESQMDQKTCGNEMTHSGTEIKYEASRMEANLSDDCNDGTMVGDTEELNCKYEENLIDFGTHIEGQEDLCNNAAFVLTEKRTAKVEIEPVFPLAKHQTAKKQQTRLSAKVKSMHKDSSNLESQLPLKSLENKLVSPKQKERLKRDQNCISMKEKPKVSRNNNLLTKENRQDSATIILKNHSETKALPTFESFVVEEEEGSGGYGTVYRARRKTDGKTFAIKYPHPNAHMHHVNNELKMLERFGGRNFVIKYEGSFKSSNIECFVLEHVEHDRPEVLKREIDVFQIRWYGYCMFRALASLHKQGIVHRDVKPGNFLFSRNLNKGYLIDFNLAMDLNQKYSTTNKLKTRGSSFNHVPLPSTKSAPHIKARKVLGNKFIESMEQGTVKHSTSSLEAKNMKKRADIGHVKNYPDLGGRNFFRSQGADGSGITSTKDATSTRTPSAERLREPLPCHGRKELISLVQEAMQSPDHKAVSVPTCQRKRVEAPPGKVDKKLVYITPMPLHSTGIAVAGAGLSKNKGDGKKKREGPCVGTKGFRAPEVLFRSPHQGSKVDVWSAGVTLLYLMIGRTPFTGDPEQNIKDIARLKGSEEMWEVAKLHDRESSFPSELFDIQSLPSTELEEWCKVSTKRPEFLHRIPRSLFDLVDKCLTVNPRLRISAEEALRHEFFSPCHESLKKQRLRRQGVRQDSSTSSSHLSQGQAIETVKVA